MTKSQVVLTERRKDKGVGGGVKGNPEMVRKVEDNRITERDTGLLFSTSQSVT